MRLDLIFKNTFRIIDSYTLNVTAAHLTEIVFFFFFMTKAVVEIFICVIYSWDMSSWNYQEMFSADIISKILNDLPNFLIESKRKTFWAKQIYNRDEYSRKNEIKKMFRFFDKHLH